MIKAIKKQSEMDGRSIRAMGLAAKALVGTAGAGAMVSTGDWVEVAKVMRVAGDA
jgi:hypothetical protein